MTIPVVSYTKATKSQIIKEERAVLSDGTKYELITYFIEEKTVSERMCSSHAQLRL